MSRSAELAIFSCKRIQMDSIKIDWNQRETLEFFPNEKFHNLRFLPWMNNEHAF